MEFIEEMDTGNITTAIGGSEDKPREKPHFTSTDTLRTLAKGYVDTIKEIHRHIEGTRRWNKGGKYETISHILTSRCFIKAYIHVLSIHRHCAPPSSPPTGPSTGSPTSPPTGPSTGSPTSPPTGPSTGSPNATRRANSVCRLYADGYKLEAAIAEREIHVKLLTEANRTGTPDRRQERQGKIEVADNQIRSHHRTLEGLRDDAIEQADQDGIELLENQLRNDV